MNLQTCPHYMRPYEKFKQYGVSGLSNTELIAILLRSGTKKMNVLEISSCLLANEENLLGLHQHTYESLQKIEGIGDIKAIQILSLLELSKRMCQTQYDSRKPFTTPKAIADLFIEKLRHEKCECFVAVYLDAKCKMITHEVISKGTLTSALVHPREVYKGAITRSSHSLVVLHNHPSGDPAPSKEDIQITKKLYEAGNIVGIQLIDHIIIGDRRFISLKEAGYL